MLMIIMHHLLVVGTEVCGYNPSHPYNLNDGCLGVFFNCLVICGVNLFVLITGYWGYRKYSWKPLSLVADCMILGLLGYVMMKCLDITTFQGGGVNLY